MRTFLESCGWDRLAGLPIWAVLPEEFAGPRGPTNSWPWYWNRCPPVGQMSFDAVAGPAGFSPRPPKMRPENCRAGTCRDGSLANDLRDTPRPGGHPSREGIPHTGWSKFPLEQGIPQDAGQIPSTPPSLCELRRGYAHRSGRAEALAEAGPRGGVTGPP
jgi:hypothetical protein